MRSNTDKSKQNLKKGKVDPAKTSGQKVSDKDSKRLAKLSAKMGNGELRGELSKNTAERDRLLAFICKRLDIMKNVQDIEIQELKHEREWYREVAKGDKGFHAPDPTRWHEPAKAFEKAADAICKGHLGKGIEELDKALKIEEKVYDKTSQIVKDKMKNEEKKANSGALGKSENAAFSMICPQVKRPAAMRLVDEILNVSEGEAKSPPMPRPWWELTKSSEEKEEEEEEENES